MKSEKSSVNLKSCPLILLPATVMKQCLDSLVPSITCIVNQSLTTRVVPPELKIARVVPLIKKPSLDVEHLNSLISNLKFLFKTIERVASSQLNAYIQQRSLYVQRQSAYRRFHSTETALHGSRPQRSSSGSHFNAS